MTLELFIQERYWPKIRVTLVPQWQKRTEELLVMICSSLGQYELTAIPVEEVEGWWLALLAKYKTPVTPNKALSRAKHILKTAIRWKLAVENPFADIRKRREPEHPFKALTDREHALLLDTANDRLKWYIVFAHYTGARRGQLAKLEERDVDLAAQTLTFRETKNGETYSIHLHSVLVEWCQRGITGEKSRRLLPQYQDLHSVTHLFRRLMKRCGLTQFRFHDFRHNVGTKLAENGHNTKVIMRALGHKDVRMSIRYTHITKEKLGEAMEESL